MEVELNPSDNQLLFEGKNNGSPDWIDHDVRKLSFKKEEGGETTKANKQTEQPKEKRIRFVNVDRRINANDRSNNTHRWLITSVATDDRERWSRESLCGGGNKHVFPPISSQWTIRWSQEIDDDKSRWSSFETTKRRAPKKIKREKKFK